MRSVDPFDTPQYDIAYQGCPGSFSETAANDFGTGDSRLLSCSTFRDVFEEVSTAQAVNGVVPIENTIVGSVDECYDLLSECNHHIVGYTVKRITHCLIAPPGTPLDGIRQVFSHPVALAQCQEFFRANPRIQAVPFYDTAGAVATILSRPPENSAAIAAARTAKMYGGEVVAAGIQDNAENYTRFLLIARAANTGASFARLSSVCPWQ